MITKDHRLQERFDQLYPAKIRPSHKASSETSHKAASVKPMADEEANCLPSDPESASDEPVPLPGETQCCEADCLDRLATMPDYARKADEIRQRGDLLGEKE